MLRSKWLSIRSTKRQKRKETPNKTRARPKAVHLVEHNIRKLARRLKRGTI